MQTFQTVGTLLPGAPDWHARFLAMLPAIKSHAQRAFCGLAIHERDEAVQSALAYAFIAYSRLVDLQKSDLGYATPLAHFGVKQYRAGRLIGCRANSGDVGSIGCRLRGCIVEPLDDLNETLCETRHATPAEIAALRIDMSDWLKTLSPRDQRLALVLARGEPTGCVAKMFRITAGRVSQLRQQLYQSWRRFTGEDVSLA